MKKRIAFGGIHIESGTLNPVLTTVQDFLVLQGQDLLDHPMFDLQAPEDTDLIPLLHARALPGGPVSREAYQGFKSRFLDLLQAVLPLDGVYLLMHGAMAVEDLRDPEGDWIQAVRALVGPEVLVSVSCDLHGNVSQQVVGGIDMFAAYRTAPHIDVLETRQRGFHHLHRALDQGVRPSVCWCPVPVLLPGEMTSTVDEPARSLYARLPELESEGVWEVSLMVGYVWADHERSSASVVTTGTDLKAMQEATLHMAQMYWDHRYEFQFGTDARPLEQVMDWLHAGNAPHRILADSGDNPTAGGVGDRADVLKTLLEGNVQNALVAGIAAPEVTLYCASVGVGQEVEVVLGGELDPTSPKVQARLTVMQLCNTHYGVCAVVETQGIVVVLCEKRRPFHDLKDFQELHLNPADFSVLVVKSGYLSPELAALGWPALLVLSEGAVCQDLQSLPGLFRKKALFPFSKDFDFQAQAFIARHPNNTQTLS